MSSPDPLPILQTKLHPPRVAHGPILRPQLFELLDAGENNPLTLVSAPPGYGKSVLLATWLVEREPTFGWVSLDEGDNDLKVFLQYFIAAIQKQNPGSCQSIANLVNNPQPLDHTHLAAHLTEEILVSNLPVLVVLDDFHRIRNKEIHEFVSELIQKPPPLFRLIILTRRDPPLPLNTLRSQGGLTEIRMQDLRFQIDETTQFLSPVSDSPLSDATLKNLDKHLEGWAAGIRLVSLNLRYCEDVNQFLGELKGSPQAIREYLMNEVLEHQPAMFRQCLLKVSTLDRFCAELCKDLCISSDPTLEAQCQKMHGEGNFPLMDMLLESNLFMISLDDEGKWYRFHHLFQDFLLDRLKKETESTAFKALYCHAADWFERNNLIEEAVSYSLRGADPSEAVKLVRKYRHPFVQLEQDVRFSRLIDMLPPELAAEEPEFLLHQAWLVMEFLELDTETVLDRAEQLINKLPANSKNLNRLKGEVETMRSVQYSEATDYLEARRRVETALTLLDEDQLTERGVAVIIQVFTLQMEGRMNEAQAVIFAAFEDPHIQETAFHTRMLASLCFLHWLEADFKGMLPVIKELDQLGRKLDFPETIAHALSFKGIIHYERNEIDEAEDPLTEVVEKYFEVNLKNSTHSAFALALVYEAQKRPEEARALAEKMIRQALEVKNASLLLAAEAFMADINLRHGKMADASLWAKNFKQDPNRSAYRFFVPHLTLIKIFMAENNPKSLKKASALTAQLEEIYTKIHNTRVLIHVLILKSLCLQRNNEESAALDALSQAVQLAQPGGIIRPFIGASMELIPLLNRLKLDAEGIEYVGRILSGFSGLQDRGSDKSQMEPPITRAIDDPLIDPLTDRELEILQLLTLRLSNKEIAERLFIAPGTVKRHTNTIYRKLNVHGRRDAVAKARGLGFISEN